MDPLCKRVFSFDACVYDLAPGGILFGADHTLRSQKVQRNSETVCGKVPAPTMWLEIGMAYVSKS
jgi:hypothetical protein